MAATSWAPVADYDPAQVGRSLLTAILTRRERVPAYQASGVSGVGEDVEPTVGQIWPR